MPDFHRLSFSPLKGHRKIFCFQPDIIKKYRGKSKMNKKMKGQPAAGPLLSLPFSNQAFIFYLYALSYLLLFIYGNLCIIKGRSVNLPARDIK